ncbi:MAG: N-6 DNA methylase [Promethearchaeota archaeon]
MGKKRRKSTWKTNLTQGSTLIGDFVSEFQEVHQELTSFFDSNEIFVKFTRNSQNAGEVSSKILYRVFFFHQFGRNNGNSDFYETIYPLLTHTSDRPNFIPNIIKLYDVLPQNIIEATNLAQDKALLQSGPVSDILADIDFPYTSLERLVTYLHNHPNDNSNVDLLGLIHQAGKNISQRKLIGQFYTPEIIREFIIQNLPWNDLLSLANENENKNDIMTLLDPACGTGGFLINLNHKISLLQKSQNISNSVKDKSGFPRFRLMGLDIDEKAIQLAKFNLFSRHRNKNIFELPYFSVWDAIRKELCKDLLIPGKKPHKCLLVVGNPPFFEINKFKGFEDAYPELAEVRKPNIASLFLIKYSQWLAPNGILAFVFPASMLFSVTFLKTRQFILSRFRILRIVQLGKVFSQVGLEQVILVIQNLPPTSNHLIDVLYGIKSVQVLSNKDYIQTTVRQEVFQQDPYYRFTIFRSQAIDAMLLKIHEKCKPLKNFVDNYSIQSRLCIFRGLGLEKWSSSQSSPRSQSSKESKISGSKITDLKIPDLCTIIFKGNDLIRYGTKSGHYIDNKYLKFATSKMQAMILREKIILQRLVSSRTRIVATLVGKDVFSLSTVENIILKPQYSNTSKSEEYKDFIYYLLALLNSDFMTYFIIDHVFIRCKLSTSLDRQYLENLPIMLPSLAKLTKIASLTREILSYVDNRSSSDGEFEEILNFENNPTYISMNRKINEQIAAIYELSHDEQNLIKDRIQEFYG